MIKIYNVKGFRVLPPDSLVWADRRSQSSFLRTPFQSIRTATNQSTSVLVGECLGSGVDVVGAGQNLCRKHSDEGNLE